MSHETRDQRSSSSHGPQGREKESPQGVLPDEPRGEEANSIPRRQGPMGFVYFVETKDKQYIKIGFSVRPMTRLSELGTLRPSGFALSLIGCIPGSPETERWLHHKFAHLRDNGEWFSAKEELRQ